MNLGTKQSSYIKKGIGVAIIYVLVKWLIIGTVGTLLYRSGYWSNWYFLLAPLFGLIIFKIIGNKIINPRNLPKYAAIFDKHIAFHFQNESKQISVEVVDNFLEIRKDVDFIKTSGNPMDRRLDFCAYFLALIKVLDKINLPYNTIEKICMDITIEYVQPNNMLEAYIKRLPPKLIRTWLGQKLVSTLKKKLATNISTEGFIANIVTDKKETFGLGYGVDILECGICKLFKKYNYYKYASILCEVDKITTQLAGLEMIRTGTIANGAKKCDFRYRLNKTN